MSPLTAILKMRYAALRNKARNLKRDSLAKTFVVLFGLGNVVGLGFWVAYESFKFIEGFPAFGSALNAKMVSLLFFALLILVVLSTVIVTYTTIFIARETEFLFQFPVPPRILFFFKATEALAFSSWATLFLCFPVLVAFGYLRGAPASYYPQMVAVLVTFVLFAGMTGTALAILIAPLARVLSPRQLLAIGGILLATLAAVFLRSFQVWDMDGENNLLILDRFTAQLSTIHSPYFPGSWASSAVLAAAAGNHREVLFQGATLLANTLIFLPALAWYGKRHYGGQWVLCHAATGTVRGRAPRRADPGAEVPSAEPLAGAARLRDSAPTGLVRTRGPLGSLVLKDIRVFIRDPAQVSQSILFVLLMVIYSLSLVRVPRYLTTGTLQLLVYFANLGAICAILSSFTSRFLFPLISLEGKAFWIVGLAPVPRSYILHAKLSFGLVVSLSLGVATTVVSNFALRVPPLLFAEAIYTVILAGICLNALATGLGATYPVFDEDNPARIAVGLGGTLNFFASALAVALLIGMEATPYLFLGEDPGGWQVLAHIAALGFTVALYHFCFRIASRTLERSEF